jgi:Fe(3+) dicitrate transport protein
LINSLGIRYEDIKLNSLNYGTNDVSLEQRMDPRFRILYKISDDYNIFTSVHKGFSPPGIRREDENSLNTD